ncbi:hypothetical protein HMPREF3187_01801 [Aerococcus christensenii]|uniref:Uncharacterized protein n=1 Tax=Aerococcus christensenii TaxID=87541 RepID=A0A133XPB8_9LACT|nr:hypothetical protein HMPREF3187_01801 [Aerococcus christensenii]
MFYDPKARSERFSQFVDEIMSGDCEKVLKRAMACSLALGSVGAIVLPTSQAIVYAAVTMKTVGPASNPHRPSNFPQNGELERLILWEQPRDDSPEVEVHGISGAVVEKVYWVSFILDYLFNENKRKEILLLKAIYLKNFQPTFFILPK